MSKLLLLNLCHKRQSHQLLSTQISISGFIKAVVLEQHIATARFQVYKLLTALQIMLMGVHPWSLSSYYNFESALWIV